MCNKGSKLLTVETEVNGDSKSTNERGPSLVGCTRDFCSTVHWLLQSVQYKIFTSSTYTFSVPLSPSLSKLDRQTCWVACLIEYSKRGRGYNIKFWVFYFKSILAS